MIGAIYNEIIYRPLLNALVVLYNTIAFHDLGIAIILLTLVVRFALYPLFYKQLHHNAKLQKIQPHLKRIKEEHKNNREKEVEATLALFKEHGTSPFTAMFLSLAQFPIIIALYQLFARGLGAHYAANLYAFVSVPPELHHSFLGLINLTEPHTILIVIVAIAQYFQGKTALPKPQNPRSLTPQEKTARRTLFIIPVVITLVLLRLPAAVGLYWLVSALFSIAQQRIIQTRLEQHAPGTIHQATP